MTAEEIYGPIVPVKWLHTDRKPRQANGWRFGSFTVHGHAADEEQGFAPWSVNHAETGMHIYSFWDIGTAKRFCEEIEPLCDWKEFNNRINGRKLYSDPPQYGARLRELVYDIARRMEGDE